MPLNLGSSSVLVRVGSGSPAKVFLGSVSVLNTPSTPTLVLARWQELGPPGSGTLDLSLDALPFNGGSAITNYRVYADGVFLSVVTITANGGPYAFAGQVEAPDSLVGEPITLSAVNAVGEGSQSDPVNATA